MGLFSRSKILDEQQIAQLFDLWAWLLGSFDGFDDFLETELVLPSEEHFPLDDLDDEALPGVVFDRVRHFAGLESWDCELVAQEQRERSYTHGAFIQEGWDADDPLGTFHLKDGELTSAVISYAPALVGQPESLVATLIHELAHYLLSTAEVEPPGGRAALEPATDVATVFLGFGIFGANAAFQYSAYQDHEGYGWQFQSAGYLSEAEWAYALAVFLSLRGLPPSEALDWLSDSPRGYLKKALTDLKQRAPELARLREVQNNLDCGPEALVARELERCRGGTGRLVGHIPGTVLGNRLVARRLLDREITDLYSELATSRRRKRAPKEPLAALQHWCSLCAATVLLREERPDEARRGIREFEKLDATTAPEEMPIEAIEMALALYALAGEERRVAELLTRRQRLPLEEGFEIVSHELLFLASAAEADGEVESLVWSAVRGWLSDLEQTGGETALMLVCLLAARLGQSGLALADLIRRRLSLLENHRLAKDDGLAQRRFVWHPHSIELVESQAGEPRLCLHVAVSGRGRVDGAITDAPPITSHLHTTVASLEEALKDSALRSQAPSDAELNPATNLELSKRLQDPEQSLHVRLHVPSELQLQSPDLAVLEQRFKVAMAHLRGLRVGFPQPGNITLAADE